MERTQVLASTFLTVFVLLVPQVNGQLPAQRPLCVSQLTLANYACGRLAPSSTSVSEAESPSNNLLLPDHHRHRHRHGHEGGDHDHHDGETQTDDCCQWLNDLDDECICELLIGLPPFLSRLFHQYTVIINDSCKVTYTCNGRTKP